MTGNTAIFYDIENLLKGYNMPKQYINNISLKNIFKEVEKIPKVKRILVQKAYANWSDSRLSVMKKDINELGIEPVQIFGFSFYQKKNAADIQLAVDAIDLAYVRSNIDIFVIVSGDGGFSAVARKLHEYGKYVIACGYKSSTNQILESMCDYFIGIDDPEESNININNEDEDKQDLEDNLKITNPLVLKMSQSLDRLFSNKREDIIKQSENILNWFIEDKEARRELSHTGIHLSVIKEAFKYGIDDFDPTKIGLSKFIQFLQYTCRNTDLQILVSDKFQTKLTLKNVEIENFEPLPFLDDNFLHSPENYKAILATGHPRIKIIDSEDFLKITSAIASLRDHYNLDSLSEKINSIYPDIENDNINGCLLSLISLDIFNNLNSGKHISEKVFQLKLEYQDHKAIIKKFRQSIFDKLSSFWGQDLKENVIEEIILDF